MSTRGVIARATGEAKFAGRYHHSDSYGTGLGDTLIALYRGHFQRDLERMLEYLIDAPHAVCGWSTIVGRDFRLKPAYTWQKAVADGAKYEVYSQRPDYKRPQCFAGRPGEDAFEVIETDDTDCEFAYVFETVDEKNIMHVLDRTKQPQGTGYYWRDIGTIDLDSDTPDWDEIECGKSEGWSRCHHTAQYHGINSPLSMQAFLENHPLDPIHDPVAYRIDGRTYKASGSGGSSDYMNRGRFPRGTWVASLIAGNNRRVELPVAHLINGEYKLLDNVVAVYPPTVRRTK
jgi:hypothetical protein